MLKLLLLWFAVLQPLAPAKLRSTYADTAAAMSRALSEHAPVFDGADGRERTGVVLATLGSFESTLRPKAVGDHGRSYGLFQDQNHGKLTDAYEESGIAIEAIRESFHICRARPIAERLAFYAGGSNAPHDADGCPTNEEAVTKSKHRMLRALWIFRHYPPPSEVVISML